MGGASTRRSKLPQILVVSAFIDAGRLVGTAGLRLATYTYLLLTVVLLLCVRGEGCLLVFLFWFCVSPREVKRPDIFFQYTWYAPAASQSTPMFPVYLVRPSRIAKYAHGCFFTCKLTMHECPGAAITPSIAYYLLRFFFVLIPAFSFASLNFSFSSSLPRRNNRAVVLEVSEVANRNILGVS